MRKNWTMIIKTIQVVAVSVSARRAVRRRRRRIQAQPTKM